MPAKPKITLVVDASIICTCEELSDSGQQCQDVLDEMIASVHTYGVILTDPIWDEWSRHQTRFGASWLKRMYARKRVYEPGKCENAVLRENISHHAADERRRSEMLKDVHLIEAAQATDKRVLSLDNNTARKMFHQLASRVRELKDILWANPTVAEEQVIAWLNNGALAEPRRFLGCDHPYFTPRQD